MPELRTSAARNRWNVALLATWFSCIVLGSLQPRWKAFFHTRGKFHLPVHFVVFTLSGFFAFGFAASGSTRVYRCLALVGLAFILEGLERAIYPIHFEWRDFATDTLGALFALLLVSLSQSPGEIALSRTGYR